MKLSVDKDIWSHGEARPADLKGERVEDYYEILEELGRYAVYFMISFTLV